MGLVHGLRRRWLGLGIDTQFLVLFTVGGVVGVVLAWGEGARNGKSPTVNIVFTVLFVGTLGYTWWQVYQRRGTRFIGTDPAPPPPAGEPRSTSTDGPHAHPGPDPTDRS